MKQQSEIPNSDTDYIDKLRAHYAPLVSSCGDHRAVDWVPLLVKIKRFDILLIVLIGITNESWM